MDSNGNSNCNNTSNGNGNCHSELGIGQLKRLFQEQQQHIDYFFKHLNYQDVSANSRSSQKNSRLPQQCRLMRVNHYLLFSM